MGVANFGQAMSEVDRGAREMMRAPRTIVMDDDRIMADGMTKEILEDEKLLNEHELARP